jgi:hypothetical protein
MILYNAIKYKILDYCLDSFFRAVRRNFSIFSKRIDPRELKEGSVIKTLFINWGTRYDTVEDVEIINIRHNDDNSMSFRIFGRNKNGTGYTAGYEGIPKENLEFFV